MHKRFWYFLACIALAFTFILPEFLLYKNVDTFQEPLRLYRGDVLHYWGILQASRSAGGPVANAYFHEWTPGLSNFYLFQSVVGNVVPSTSSLSIVWLALSFQVGVAFLVFFALSRLLLSFDVPERYASPFAFAFTLFFGPVAFRGSALSSWFYPFLIIGIWAVLTFYREKHSILKSAGLLLIALFCFSLQPVYFSLGMAVTGLLWLLKLYEERSLRFAYLFFVWLLAVGTVFYCLFLPFLTGLPGSTDILERFVSSHTRIPFHPLISLRFLIVSLLSLGILRTLSEKGSEYKKWMSVAVLAFVAFLGINSYLITGTYIANDHYGIAEDITIFLFTATLLVSSLPSQDRRFRWGGALLLLVTLFSLFDTLQYLGFSLGYSGKWIPLYIAYFASSLVLLFPQLRTRLEQLIQWRTFLVALFVVGAFAYGNVLLYKDGKAHDFDHVEAQSYRPLVEALRLLPSGVILADPRVDNIASLFTDHKLYWHSSAYGERVTTSELHDRFLDTKLFFSDSPFMSPDWAVTGVYGSTNHCSEYKRNVYLKWYADKGLTEPYRILCEERTIRREAWRASLDAEFAQFASGVEKTNTWKPRYAVDYLVITKNNKALPEKIIKKYFTEIVRVEGAVVYRYSK